MQTRIALFAASLALFALSGCVVVMGPGWYRPAPPAVVYATPPPCPQGFVWTPQTGCVPAPPQTTPQPVYAAISVPVLNLRTCPGKDCQSLAALDKGRMLQILEVKEGWTRVWSPDAMREGWVDSTGLAAY